MQGAPYYVSPVAVIKEWTLPQTLFTYLGIQESLAADSRQQFLMTMAAIGAVLSKDGKRIVRNVMDILDGNGQITEEELFDTLSETQQLVLFGKDKKEAYDYKHNEHQTNSNSNSN